MKAIFIFYIYFLFSNIIDPKNLINHLVAKLTSALWQFPNLIMYLYANNSNYFHLCDYVCLNDYMTIIMTIPLVVILKAVTHIPLT